MRRALLRTLAAVQMVAPFGACLAADIGKASHLPGAPPMPAFHSWTGVYAGIQAGYGVGDASGTQNGGGTFFPVVPYSIDPHGFIGGGHLGYNHQIGQWVFGLEGDLEAANVKGLTTQTAAGLPYFFNTDAQMLASVRGRAGIALDAWLLYTTGGVAWANVDTPPLNALSSTRTGWTLGAGVEYALNPNWTTRLEYRYTDFGRERAPGAEAASFDDNAFSFHALRVGLTYRFGRSW